MKKTFLSKVLYFLESSLKIQLFIGLVSLPFLIAWGIPMSVFSVVGNIIFSPFLYLVLWCSSCIFFTHLLGIPNGIFFYFLETITMLWKFLLGAASFQWLVGVPCEMVWLSIFLCFLLFVSLYSRTRSMVIFMIILIIVVGTGLGMYVYNKKVNTSVIMEIECNQRVLHLMRDNNKTVLIDTGALGRRASSVSWVEYTLIPLLVKNFGSSSVDTLIILKPGILMFQAVTALLACTPIKTIYLVSWQGDAPRNFLRAYGELSSMVKRMGGTLSRIYSVKKNIILSPDSYVDIVPGNFDKIYRDIMYNSVIVKGNIKGKKIYVSTDGSPVDTVC